MDQDAFTSRQRAIRAEAAMLVRDALALRGEDAVLRQNLDAMRTARAARQAHRAAAGRPAPSGGALPPQGR